MKNLLKLLLTLFSLPVLFCIYVVLVIISYLSGVTDEKTVVKLSKIYWSKFVFGYEWLK